MERGEMGKQGGGREERGKRTKGMQERREGEKGKKGRRGTKEASIYASACGKQERAPILTRQSRADTIA